MGGGLSESRSRSTLRPIKIHFTPLDNYLFFLPLRLLTRSTASDTTAYWQSAVYIRYNPDGCAHIPGQQTEGWL